MEARRKDAWREAHAIAELLVTEYQAEKVWLFGSCLVEWKPFKPDSDLDIAITGVPPDKYYRAVAAVNDIASRGVDLNSPLSSPSS